jgi:N-methylhydantoinase B
MEDAEPDRSIPLVAHVEVSAQRVRVDYTGTGGQSEYAVNSVYNYTYAYTSHAVKCVVSPHDPMNEGFMRVVEMTAPEGTVVNPRFPAAVGARHLLNWRINSLIFRALADVVPDRVAAPSGGTGSCMPQFLGTDPRTGKTFVQIANHSGGLGGRPNKDGIHAYPFPARAENTPIEVLEHSAPLRAECLELIQDSGGPGKFRGGCGVRVQFRILTTAKCVVGAVAGRDRYPAQGIFNGKEGSKSGITINPDKSGYAINPRKLTLVEPGDLVEFRLPGGGGYGDPKTRDPMLVLKDLEAGIVSPEKALNDYGVVIDRAKD